MARVEFQLPDVGEGLEEGEIVSWLVAPGETVARDQPLVEVQTDKALVELPSPIAGHVVSLAFAPGDIVKVGQTLVVLDDGHDPTPSTETSTAGLAAIGMAPARPAAPLPPVNRAKAAPAVRRLAVERGISLATITGSGPNGRILATDVEAASISSTTGVADRAVPAVSSAGLAHAENGAEAANRRIGWMEAGRHTLRGIRRATAEAMSRSWSEIPHFTILDEVEATGLLIARRRMAHAGIDATIGALLLAAAARGLRRYPIFNASLEAASSESGATIVVHADCNVGLAVATAEGLVVPVVKQADRRSLPAIAAEVRRLTAAARDRKSDVGDLRGGTFTISNYGSLGGRFATPLIRGPEVGIMGFGAIRSRPFVVDGELRVVPTLPWSLSADHRVIDGDVATAFGEYVTGLLADPIALFANFLGDSR